jgi:cytochrome c oxidase subunit III
MTTIDPTKTSLNYHHSAEVSAHGEGHPDFRIMGIIFFLIAEGMIFLIWNYCFQALTRSF